MMGFAIAYDPCVSCEKKEMCSMCELTMRRNGAIKDEKLREQECDAAFVDAYAKALEDALEHPEKYNDIFEGYENSLPKALALIEWQKQEIEYLEEKK